MFLCPIIFTLRDKELRDFNRRRNHEKDKLIHIERDDIQASSKFLFNHVINVIICSTNTLNIILFLIENHFCDAFNYRVFSMIFTTQFCILKVKKISWRLSKGIKYANFLGVCVFLRNFEYNMSLNFFVFFENFSMD